MDGDTVSVERAREALAEIQKQSRDALNRAASAEERANAAEQAIAKTQDAVKALTEAYDADRLRSVESAAGGRGELDYYVARADETARTLDSSAYGRVADASVRLRGAKIRMEDGSIVWRAGLLDDVNAKSEAQITLQKAHTTARIAAQLCGGQMPAQAVEMVRNAARECGGAVERIFTAVSGSGLEWGQIQYAPELERRQMARTGLRQILEQRVVAAGRSTSIPQLTGDVQFYDESVPSVNDPSGVPPTSVGSNERFIVTKSIAARSQADRKMDDESAIDWASTIQQLMVEQWAFQTDDSIVNGDTATPHQDAIATWNLRGRYPHLVAALDHRKRYLGLRALAFDIGAARTPDQGSTQTYAGVEALIALLGSEHVAPAGLDGGAAVIVCSWRSYRKMLNFAEFLTWDKAGPYASVLTGRLGAMAPGGVPLPNVVGMFNGTIPVVINDAVSDDLADSGLYTGSGAKSGVLVFDRSRFEFVQQSGTEVATIVNPMNNTRQIVMRNYQADLSRKNPAETAPVAFGRNWS